MERIAQLMALTDDLAKLETQKRDVAMQHLLILNQEKALEESREKLEAAKGVLNATLDRIDVNFLALYQIFPAPVAAVVEEPKRTRGKKVKETPAPEEKPVEDKAARRLAILQDPASPPCAKCHAASECDDCCKSCISPCDTKQECRKDTAPVTRLPLCASCRGNHCGIIGSKDQLTMFVCTGYVGELDEAEIKRRDNTCCGEAVNGPKSWRLCEYADKCFGAANEEGDDTDCLWDRANKAAATACPKCEGAGMYIEDEKEPGGEVYCDCPDGVALREKDEANVPADAPSNEEEKQEVAPAVGESSAQASEVAQYLPLDEAVGDCELCMGYGVIEGELYGEAALVPCTCPAGIKVKGGVVASCCDNCNIEDPDCASCHLPDMAADSPVEVETPDADPAKCCNSACTANDTKNDFKCLHPKAPQECKSFVPVDACKHPKNRIKILDGRHVCTLWQSIATAVHYEPLSPKGELTALQQKCTHPKVFREETAEGIVCKVCKLVLEEQTKLF